MTNGRDSGSTADFSDEKLDLLAQMLATEGVDTATVATIIARGRPASVPLSFAQELIWLLDRASPGMTAYNSGLARRVRGSLDIRALQASLDELVARHEILRTTYSTSQDQPVQIVHGPQHVPMTVVDVSHLAAAAREAAAQRIAIDAIRAPFDLAREPAFRVALVRLDHDDHMLAIGTHHIAIDGWSRGILFRELGHLYDGMLNGEGPSLPMLPIQYADFALWQRGHVAGERLDAMLEYWRRELSGTGAELAVPTDFPRPLTTSFEGAQVALTVPAELVGDMRALAQRHQVTLYMLLLAAYQTVLHRWTGQRDILTGSPIAGRSLPETAGVLGYFANTLVLRGRFADNPTFTQLLAQFRETALGAYEHQEIPLEKLVLELRDAPDRLSTAPLFQAVLTMHDMATGDLRLGNLSLSPIGMESDSSKFDLTCIVADRPDEVRFTLHYRTDLFHAATAARLLGHVQQILRAAVVDPGVRVSKMPMLTSPEIELLAAWNATVTNLGQPDTVVALFERQVARVPHRPAVATSTESAARLTLTYAELNARANQLAFHLHACGVQPGAPVGLLLDRSADAIVGLLGILKAGGSYVPLSIEAPAERLQQQLAECRAEWVVADTSRLDRLPAATHAIALDRDAATLSAHPVTNPPLAAGADSLAYVLYTSGSTGVPKGVAVTHANVVHYARAVSQVLAKDGMTTSPDVLAVNDGRRFGMVSTLAADLGHTSLYPALLGGAELHILGDSVTTEPARFAEYLNHPGLDVLKITPNHWQALMAGRAGNELAAVLPREWLVFGGEALRPELARTVVATGRCRVLNHYGPTETTVGACTLEATAESLAMAAALGAQTFPIGRPLANGHAYVVDTSDNEQPVGIPGELLLGGPGVAAGYLNRPDLTTERFVLFRGEQVYRTGDRVRRLSDGTIEFLGRNDDQVKVRGFRVELGDVEEAVRAHPGVEQCAVLARRNGDGEPALAAYVVPRVAGYAAAHGERLSQQQLRTWVQARLPEYMVPTAVVVLDHLPLNDNGKLDRTALARIASAAETTEFVEPRTPTEKALVTIWAEVLKRDRVSVTDSFLEVGGHSLLAIRVLGRVSKAFGVRLPLRTLFEAPTVTQLARAVDDAMVAGDVAGGTPEISPRSRDAHRIRVVTDGDPS